MGELFGNSIYAALTSTLQKRWKIKTGWKPWTDKMLWCTCRALTEKAPGFGHHLPYLENVKKDINDAQTFARGGGPLSKLNM